MGRADDVAVGLTAHLRAHGHPDAEVHDVARLSGGASRETWSFDATWDGERHPLILRLDPPAGVSQTPRSAEMAVLAAAAEAGVPVPAVVSGTDDPAVLGAGFFVMARLEGEALPRRLLRDERYDHAREVLLDQTAAALARIHDVAPEAVPAVGRPRSPSTLVADLRGTLDLLGEPHPVFEVAMAWLDANLPPDAAPTLVHGDLRMGNLLVDEDGLVAVLDWELAHCGDPAEDLGWLCVRSWRFGRDDQHAGGVGTRRELLAAYRAAGGADVDEERLRFWEVYGNLRWGVICLVQASVHLSGAVRSVELAAIGRRACEVEHDLLDLLGAPPSAPVDVPTDGLASGQDRPTAAEALDAVAGALEDELVAALTGRAAYLAKVSSRLLRTVEREVTLGPAFGAADLADLTALLTSADDPAGETAHGSETTPGTSTAPGSRAVAGGVDGPASLDEVTRRVAAAIRSGEIDPAAALPALRRVVDRKLAIANPRWARPTPPFGG